MKFRKICQHFNVLPTRQWVCGTASLLLIFYWNFASPAVEDSRTVEGWQPPAIVEASDLLPVNGGDGSRGFVLNGWPGGVRLGISVAMVGDITGNEHADLLAGAYLWGELHGAIVLIQGNDYIPMDSHGLEMQALIDETITPLPGLVSIHPMQNAVLGRQVRFMGDLDGDGMGDLALSAQRAVGFPNSGHGEIFFIYGGPEIDKILEDITQLLPENGGDGSRGFVISGIHDGLLLGKNISGNHDFTDNGTPDLIFHGPNVFEEKRGRGIAFVLYGRAGRDFPPLITYEDLLDLSLQDGFMIVPPIPEDDLPTADFGFQEARFVSDVNGDNIDDLIICRHVNQFSFANHNGECYLLFGRHGPEPFQSIIDLGDLLERNGGDGTEGVVLLGGEPLECLGSSPFTSATLNSDQVSGVGDLDRDGFGDLLIGAPGCGIPGKAYVIYGQADWPAEIHLGTPDPGNKLQPRIMRLYPPQPVTSSRGFAQAVAGIGDFNADGYPDIALHNTFSEPLDQTGAFVIYGSPNMPEIFQTAELLPENGGDGSRGFLIRNFPDEELLGTALSAGDFNNDGTPDLALGGYASDPNGLSNAGRVVVLYGTPPDTPLQVPSITTWGLVILVGGILLHVRSRVKQAGR